MNRRPYRPTRSDISEFKDRVKAADVLRPAPPPPPPPPPQAQQPHPQPHPPHQQPKKMHPPTDTFAENYYYLKQMGKKIPMAVVFTDGQVIEGYIEWYDRNCIKLNRDGAPNLLVFKSAVKYMYKIDDGKEGTETEGDDKK